MSFELNANDRRVVQDLVATYEQADDALRARLLKMNDDRLRALPVRRDQLATELAAIERQIALREMYATAIRVRRAAFDNSIQVRP